MKQIKTQFTKLSSHTYSKYFFIILLSLVLLLTLFLIKPFISYIFVSFLLAYMFRPVYKKILKKLKSPTFTSLLVVFLIFLLIIIPVIFLLIKITGQSLNVLTVVDRLSLDVFSKTIYESTGINFDAGTFLKLSADQFKSILSFSAVTVLTSLTNVVVGLFIMFFLLFYLLIDADRLIAYLKCIIPLKKTQLDVLFKETKDVTYAILYGQILTAFVQGVVGGIGFFIFGLPNPIFWGFVMGILSLLPLIGTAIIWLPIGIMLLVEGHIFAGLGILIYSAVLTSNVDNLIRPKIISKKANIHPVLVLIGVFGGLKLFGFVGVVAGPLILALLLVLLKFYHEESWN